MFECSYCIFFYYFCLFVFFFMLKFSCVISCWSLVFVVLVLLHWTVLRSPNQINFYINNSKCTYRGGYLLVFSLALVLCRRCCYIYIFRPFFTLLAVFFLSFFIFFFGLVCRVFTSIASSYNSPYI